VKGRAVGGIFVLLLLLAVAPLSCGGAITLNNYPELFRKDAMVVVGWNASQVELESAGEIAAKLEELTGNAPIVKNETNLTEANKTSYNLIIMGTPESNEVLEQVYNLTNATRVTEEYPGTYKGVLEILRNPWNENRALLLVAGSDEWGVIAGSAILLTENEKLSGETMMTKLNISEMNETEPPVGGDCIYSHYPGVAVVTRIEGCYAFFVFKTDQEIKESWVQSWVRDEPGREHLLSFVRLEDLDKYHIQVGGEYNCTLNVETKGTCDPIFFGFDQFYQGDYCASW